MADVLVGDPPGARLGGRRPLGHVGHQRLLPAAVGLGGRRGVAHPLAGPAHPVRFRDRALLHPRPQAPDGRRAVRRPGQSPGDRGHRAGRRRRPSRCPQARPHPGGGRRPPPFRRPHRGRRRPPGDPARAHHGAHRAQRRRQDDPVQPPDRLRHARRRDLAVQRGRHGRLGGPHAVEPGHGPDLPADQGPVQDDRPRQHDAGRHRPAGRALRLRLHPRRPGGTRKRSCGNGPSCCSTASAWPT